MKESYQTISGEFENTIIIEHSKFICKIKGIDNEEEAKEFISSVRKEHSLATHNCYAYIADDLGLIQKFTDDGEPQGTAGFPILEVLKNRGLFKCVAVVTRYFGGIKLGAGGLVRAYSNCTSECINKSNIVIKTFAKFYTINCQYENFKALTQALNKGNFFIKDIEYTDSVNIQVAVKEEGVKDFLNILSDVFKGAPNYIEKGQDYFIFK